MALTIPAAALLKYPDLDVRISLVGEMTGLVKFTLNGDSCIEFIAGPGAFALDTKAEPGFWLWPRKAA